MVGLATGQKKIYSIGSALENANTATTLGWNGFESISRTEHGLAAVDGAPAFPGERFNLIAWRMSRSDSEDDLKQFVQSLGGILDTSSEARVIFGDVPWAGPIHDIDVVRRFEDAGFTLVKEDSSPKDDFYVFKRAPQPEFTGSPTYGDRLVNKAG